MLLRWIAYIVLELERRFMNGMESFERYKFLRPEVMMQQNIKHRNGKKYYIF